VVFEDRAYLPRGEEFVDVVVVLAGMAVCHGLDVVAVGTVADIVEERRRAQPFGPDPVDAEVIERAVGEVVDPERMLEPGVVRGGVHQVDRPQLRDVSEPLNRLRIEESGGDALDLDVVVDAVLDRHHTR
jgi:hypothetical protein